MENENNCANCGNALSGKYCSQCGQKVDAPRFTFRHILEEAFHAFTHADKSFLVFVRKMFMQPGIVAYEYIVERKRKKYYNPFTFFLLVSAINALLTGYDLDLKERLFHANNEYGHIFNVYEKLLSLVIIPLFAVAVWLLNYKKTRLRYSEYTIYAMLLISLLGMIASVEHVVNYIFTALLHRYVDIEDTLITLLLIIAYITYADYQFNKKMNADMLPKSFLAALLMFVIIFTVQLFIVYAVLNNFRGIGHFGGYGIQVS